MKWFVYIVRCIKGAFYTGITTNLDRRINQHNTGNGSKAIKALGRPVFLVYTEQYKTRSEASKREYEIKQLSNKQKQDLILNGNDKSHSK
jgi:putative endonuclease